MSQNQPATPVTARASGPLTGHVHGLGNTPISHRAMIFGLTFGMIFGLLATGFPSFVALSSGLGAEIA